ncbi:hypothetical protein ACHAWC_001488 [Mediolabrus comicus]
MVSSPRMIIILLVTAAISCLLASSFAFSSSSILKIKKSITSKSVSTTRIYEGVDEITDDVVDKADDENTDANPCGEGFYPVAGEHGQVCVFDYEAASNSFGTTVEEHKNDDIVCDADDYWNELEEKNKVRRKYGLDPLTPEQFVVLQAEILEMEETNRKKFQDAKVEAKAIRDKEASVAAAAADSKGVSGILKGFFGSVFEDTCESNYDCDRPEVCCDFGFKKMCCEGGKTARDLYSSSISVI